MKIGEGLRVGSDGRAKPHFSQFMANTDTELKRLKLGGT